jgi:hypothetical protein
MKSKAAIAAFAESAGADDVRSARAKMPNARRIGWAVYVAGFVIWLVGYVSVGHASAFDWQLATPWWISSFVPNLEAEFGLALMFASMVPITGAQLVKRSAWHRAQPRDPKKRTFRRIAN